jgi:hypothetical protein
LPVILCFWDWKYHHHHHHHCLSSSCKVIFFCFVFLLSVFIQIGKACGEKWKTMTFEVSFSLLFSLAYLTWIVLLWLWCLTAENWVNHKLSFKNWLREFCQLWYLTAKNWVNHKLCFKNWLREFCQNCLGF